MLLRLELPSSFLIDLRRLGYPCARSNYSIFFEARDQMQDVFMYVVTHIVHSLNWFPGGLKGNGIPLRISLMRVL